MKLYIANATFQKFVFMYRLPGSVSLRTATVERGFQVQVGGEMTSDEVQYVLEKAEAYGFVTVAQAVKQGGFSGICYSIDRPITEAQLRDAMMKRVSVLDAEGHAMRHAAAVGAHIATREHLRQHQELGTDLLSMDTNIVEQDINGRSHNLANPLSETHQTVASGVNPEAPLPTLGRGRGGRGRRAA